MRVFVLCHSCRENVIHNNLVERRKRKYNIVVSCCGHNIVEVPMAFIYEKKKKKKKKKTAYVSVFVVFTFIYADGLLHFHS